MWSGNADEAIALLKARSDIEVIFTDSQMPGSMDGLRLAKHVKRKWPPIKNIVTSGRFAIRAGDLPDGGVFPSKPYTPSMVTTALQDFNVGGVWCFSPLDRLAHFTSSPPALIGCPSRFNRAILTMPSYFRSSAIFLRPLAVLILHRNKLHRHSTTTSARRRGSTKLRGQMLLKIAVVPAGSIGLGRTHTRGSTRRERY